VAEQPRVQRAAERLAVPRLDAEHPRGSLRQSLLDTGITPL
jgi:hypothetical protein